jgi:hypothetical protein
MRSRHWTKTEDEKRNYEALHDRRDPYWQDWAEYGCRGKSGSAVSNKSGDEDPAAQPNALKTCIPPDMDILERS